MDRAMGGLCDQAPGAWPPPSPKPNKRKPGPVIRQPNQLSSQPKKQPLPPLTFPDDDEEDEPTPPPKKSNTIQHYNPHRVYRDDPYDDPPEVQLARQREAEREAQFNDHEDTDWGAEVDGEYRDSIFSPGEDGWQFEQGWQLDLNAASDDEDDIADVNLGAIGKVTDVNSGGEVSGTLQLVNDVALLPEGFNIKNQGALSVSCIIGLNEPGENDEDDLDMKARLEPVPKDLKPVEPQPNPDDLVGRLVAKGLHLDFQRKLNQKQESIRLTEGGESSNVQTEDDPVDTDTKHVKAKRTAPAPSPFIARRKVLPRSVKKVLDEKQKKESDARVARMKEERKRHRTRGSVSLAPVASEEMDLLEES